MNKKKLAGYVKRRVDEYVCKDNYLRPCLIEGLIYSKSLYAESLCNKCKFNMGGGYYLDCDIMNERLVLN